MNHTFSLLFWINKAKMNKSGKAPIYARITINGRRAEVATGQSIEPERWNIAGSFAKGTKEDVRIINERLTELKNRIHRIHNNIEESGQYISADLIKNVLLGKTGTRKSLVEVFNYHNAQMKAQIGGDVAAATYKRYETTLKHLQEFMAHQYGRDDIYLTELKYPFITDLEFYLKTVRKCNHNSTLKYIRNFRKIVHLAIANEWLDKDPFMKFKVKLKEVKRDYLTKEELLALEEKELSVERLDQVRDVFVFCCYTGLSYVDVEKLTPKDISRGLDGEYWIFTERTKTGNSSNVPLLPKALEIIGKYKEHPVTGNSERLLPVISNQKMNAYLKELATLCDIQKTMTFHMARHTFATTVTLTNGVSIETVSSMLGHKNLKTTQIYAKVVQSKVSEDMGKLREKLTANNPSERSLNIAKS